MKLVATFGFVVAVALTPREALWAFAGYALMLVVSIRMARLGPRFVLARMTVVIPFVAFAFLIPFIASGERVEILGVSVSEEGLWGMWNILVKATLGITASIVLAATTEVPGILDGLSRLRVPRAMTAIAGFMVRYLTLIAEDLRRMRTAMTSRGYDPRWLWQVRPIAVSAGTMFIRSYERGERVHQAMLARGFDGTMPDLDGRRAGGREWAFCAAWLMIAASITALALVVS